MSELTARALLITIAILSGIIVGIVAWLLAVARGEHQAAAIREGGIGFAGGTGFVLVLLNYLGVP
ncbi:hypothetical protein [Nocardia goodfellowii]|uniref:Uncharacterized protein n=1 Tax=Nocardia goodfellowii TaxID=882446 RepID=A0ABS4QFL8_9NOCA|nr:hypothetical protein [Nocardia goodfellowii]MBP2189950.1 hypothetical protein [Nocardia goodfellowii]